jgi:hypothetical protein
MVQMRILAPVDNAGSVMELVSKRRGTDMTTQVIDERTWIFKSRMPWAEVVTDFHDELKNATAGYASYDTVDDGVQKGALAKVRPARAQRAHTRASVKGEAPRPLSLRERSGREARASTRTTLIFCARGGAGGAGERANNLLLLRSRPNSLLLLRSRANNLLLLRVLRSRANNLLLLRSLRSLASLACARFARVRPLRSPLSHPPSLRWSSR